MIEELYVWLGATSAGVTAGVVVSLITLWLSERWRNQRIRKNLLKAVDIETEHNIKMAIKNNQKLANYTSLALGQQASSIVLTPFRTSLIGKHLEQLEILENFKAIEKLLEGYSLIEEANSSITVVHSHLMLPVMRTGFSKELCIINSELEGLNIKIKNILDEARESLNLEKLKA